MKTVILSDIHANLHALEAVLRDAGTWDRLVFLGDLANFGSHPVECAERLKACAPICVMGNHDAQIVSEHPEHFWDQWAKRQLDPALQEWMAEFRETVVLDGHILLIHGAASVSCMVPNINDEDMEAAFRDVVTEGIDQVWFGHYHYQIDRKVNGVEYHCIRPVGQHRDGDTKTGYSVYEDGCLTHIRVPYDLDGAVADFEKLTVFKDAVKREQFADFLRHAWHRELLKEDIRKIAENGNSE